MYDELVGRLRASCESCKLWDGEKCCLKGDCSAHTRLEAADAIEELAAFKAQITDGHFYCMRDGVLYEAKVEPPKGKVFHLPQIEFQEPPKEE